MDGIGNPSLLLREARTRAALSQRVLAARAGTTQAVVARIESGAATPTFETLSRLLAAAGFDLVVGLTPHLAPDPVIEAYKPGVDQTLLIENLRRTQDQRMGKLADARAFTREMQRGMRAAKGLAEPSRPYGSATQDDMAGLLAVLDGKHVEYVVIGGVAANAHGSARVTWDIDVAYSRTDENLARLAEALRPLRPYLRGAPPGLPFEWSAATLRAGLNFTLSTSLGDLDILGEVTGGGRYEDLAGHAIVMSLFGRDRRVLDIPWLIRCKRAAGRPKDLEAIAELELLQELRSKKP